MVQAASGMFFGRLDSEMALRALRKAFAQLNLDQVRRAHPACHKQPLIGTDRRRTFRMSLLKRTLCVGMLHLEQDLNEYLSLKTHPERLI